MRKLVTVLALAIVISVVFAAPAWAHSAPTWHQWHVVTLPNGEVDAVRVKHLEDGTRCDFLLHDNLGGKLISLDAPYRACVPNKDR